MALVEWAHYYSVGVQEMDNDHKKLITMINTLFAAIQKGESKITITALADEMLQFTKEHFSKEETYMLQANYPGLLNQKEQHAIFLKKVNELSDKINQDKFNTSVEMLNFLNNWLIIHVCGEDQSYSSYFSHNGIK
jgi:hemerythrin-like metal-binding protein